MPDPTVVCVMLTANRPEMAKQAVACFLRQTYTGKCKLMILDTGEVPAWPSPAENERDRRIGIFNAAHYSGPENLRAMTIGELRNFAARCVPADIICHFDDDDYSAPQRISEQVASLQASGAEAAMHAGMSFVHIGGTCECLITH